MTRSLLVAAFLLVAGAASAQDGRAVSCGCWCGAVLAPPCSDSACISACGGSPTYASTGTSEPPMAGVKVGTWTKHFGHKYSENLQNCGSNPLCMGMSTVVAAITVPIGLVVDIPVVLVKGLGTGFYYAGKVVAAPFKPRPKRVKPVVEIVAPPPAVKAGADCSGLAAEHDAMTAQLKTDAEAFNAAIVKTQLDQGVDAAKGAITDASKAADKAKQAADAKEMSDWLAGLNAGIQSCAEAKSGTDAWHKCIEALYSSYDQTLGKLAEASRVEAAKSALKDYIGGILKKVEPFAQKAAACQAR